MEGYTSPSCGPRHSDCQGLYSVSSSCADSGAPVWKPPPWMTGRDGTTEAEQARRTGWGSRATVAPLACTWLGSGHTGLRPYQTRSRSHTLPLAVTDLRRAGASGKQLPSGGQRVPGKDTLTCSTTCRFHSGSLATRAQPICQEEFSGLNIHLHGGFSANCRRHQGQAFPSHGRGQPQSSPPWHLREKQDWKPRFQVLCP